MSQNLPIGGKIQHLRKQAGLTQAKLAARLDISASYLNLIEHDRRALTKPISLKLGEILGLAPEMLSAGGEGRLMLELIEVFGDPLFKDERASREDLIRLVNTAPGVAGSISTLYRAFRDAREDASHRNEFFADNPFLDAASHRLLTLLTSIRSFSEILRDNADLAAERRQQYIGTVASESEKLTDLVNELFSFIAGEGLGLQKGTLTPESLAADYFDSKEAYVADLEDVAQDILEGPSVPGLSIEAELLARLSQSHRISVVVLPWKPDQALDPARLTRFDEKTRRLFLSEILPAPLRLFELARHLALSAAGPQLDRLASQAQLGAPAATACLRRELSKYLAAAMIMPYSGFLEAARSQRYDICVLQGRFGANFEQVCRRLTTLQRPGAEGVPFHFLRTDLAGNITRRQTSASLRIPRLGGSCPKWNLYHAFMTPGQIDTQLARLPDGSAYIFLAQAQFGPNPVKGTAARPYSISIGCEASFGRALVYADRLALDDESAFTHVGFHCRQCAWHDCTERVSPSYQR